MSTTNFELMKICKKHNIPLNGVYSKDLLNNVEPLDGGYIFNLQNSNDGDGSHWIASYLENGKVTFFDSFATGPPKEIINFLKRYSKKPIIIYNTDQIQNIMSYACGYYCIAFLLFMSKNKRLPLDDRFNKFLNIFSLDPLDNQKLLKHYLRLHNISMI